LGTLLAQATPETVKMVHASVQIARVPAMRAMLLDAASSELAASVAAYPGPVLVLAAPDEPVPGPLRAGVETRRLSGGSHWSPLDEPTEATEALAAFFRPLNAEAVRRRKAE